jgi:hypothetical protein
MLELELRLQDDEPDTPNETGFEAGLEAGWTVRF